MNVDIVPGASIVTGIEQGIYAEVEKSPIFEMHSEAPEIREVWQDFPDVCKQHQKSMKVLYSLYSLIISALERARGGVEVDYDTLTEIQNFMFLHRKSSYLIPDFVYKLLRSKSEAEAYYGAQKVCEQYQLIISI